MANDNPISRIAAVLGYELNVDADGGVYLQRAELQQIERNLNAAAPTAVLEATADTAVLESLSGISAQLQTLSTTVQGIQTTQTAQAERLDRLEDRTSSTLGPTPAKAAGDPPSGDGDGNTDLEVLKKMADSDVAALKNGMNPFSRV